MVDENAQAAVETTNEETDLVLEPQAMDETTTNDDATQAVVESHEDVLNEESEDTTNENGVPNESESNDGESPEDDPDDDDDEPFIPISKLRKVRSEAKNLRERLRDAESKLSARDESKLQVQVDSLMNELRTERLANHLTPKVQAAGAIDPEILVGLVHLDSVEWNNNVPSNVDALIDGLKEKHPRQFRASTGSGNVGTRNEPKGKLKGMTSDQLYNEAYSKT